MKPSTNFIGQLVALLALAFTPATDCLGQQNPASAAVPIKELAPPPPNPADGKHLIRPSPALPTESGKVDPATEHKWAFKNKDTNGDGKLTKAEFPPGMRPGFARADADSDQFVSEPEYLAYFGPGKPAPAPKPPLPSVPQTVLAFKDLPYAGTDNPRQRLDLYLPKEPKSDKPLPVIVFVHGGGWQKGDRSTGAGQIMRFVESGDYAAATIGYRLSDEAQWPAQIHDCKAAIRWLKANAGEYFLDPAKLGVWGTSAGGHLVSLLGTTGDVKDLEGQLGKHLDQDSRVACVVNYFGPANFLTMVKQPSSIDRTTGDKYPEALLLGGAVPERETAAREASPVTHISTGDSPFFTAHGTEDPLVPFAQAQELHAALTKAGVPSILQEITHGGHGFRSTDLDQRVMDFFNLHLRGIPGQVLSTPIVFPQK